jgi:type II secretory pathway pseudopilin PulG
MRRSSPRNGVVLLEVLVGLAILGTAGAAMAALALGASDTVRRAQRADDEMRRASALLEAVALWPREDLDRHLGVRAQGEWSMHVGHPVPALYTVSLTDSTGAHELLRTALFRPISRLAKAPGDAR